MISKQINKILPTEITYLIADYIRPDKLDDCLKNEIQSEFVYRLFKQTYNEFMEEVKIMNENEKKNGGECIEYQEPPFTPFMFEYLVDCLPHEEYNHYINCLKNHSDRDECDYFIKVIKTVIGWEQQNSFYDDEDYDEDYVDYALSHFQPIFADHGPNYLYGYDDASDI